MDYSPENKIIVKAHGNQTLPIDRLMEFQGNLKRLTQKNREKLMAYNCNRVMSNEDSRILGQALGVLQRHADEYGQEIAGRVRNGCL